MTDPRPFVLAAATAMSLGTPTLHTLARVTADTDLSVESIAEQCGAAAVEAAAVPARPDGVLVCRRIHRWPGRGA